MLVSTVIYILIPVGILIAVGAYFLIFGKEIKLNKQKKKEETKLQNVAMLPKEKYMYRKEVEFYYFLQSILRADKLVFPKVGLENIFIPDGNKVAYNNISSKYVDFVIFEESTMTPILIVDVYDNSFNDEILDEQDPLTKKILEKIKIPMISILIKGNYDKEKIKEEIYKIIYPKNENK